MYYITLQYNNYHSNAELDDRQNQEGKILWWMHTLCDGKG